VEGMRKAEWAEQLFWPLVKNKKPSLAKKNVNVER
jgi:hypothetical protein